MQCALPVKALFEADETLIADDEMVDQFNIQVMPCLHKLLGNRYILRRWRWIAAGVIVTDNYAGAVAQDGGPVDLRRAQHGAIDRSLVARDVLDHLVFRIEHQDAHLV